MKYKSLKNMTEEEIKARKRKQKAEAQRRYYQKNKDYYKNYSKQWAKKSLESKDKEILRLNNIIDTILNFGIFTTMCPMELYFDEEENESKAQDTFFKDEYCENCKDDYKKCWLKYFKELNELKGDNK